MKKFFAVTLLILASKIITLSGILARKAIKYTKGIKLLPRQIARFVSPIQYNSR